MVGRPPVLRTRCLSCNATLSLQERFAGEHCDDWQCRRRRVEARQRAELAARMHADRDAAAARLGDASASHAPVVVVRWRDAPMVPVPEAQRLAFRAHLVALQAEVDALAATPSAASDATDAGSSAPTAPAQPEIDELLGQVCARCTGYCCRLGYSRHAFLDAPTLLRVRLRQPGVDHSGLVDAYVGAMPALHSEGSCAFHGERGCVLPREHRADICNSFECPGLEQARHHAETAGVRRVYVVRHDADHEPLGAFAPPL